MIILRSTVTPHLRIAFAFALLAILFTAGCGRNAEADRTGALSPEFAVREGDVVFQSLPRMDLVVTIEGATHSPYSHCGIIAKQRDSWVVIEAIGPVRETPLSEWVNRGRGGDIDVYRLGDAYRPRIPAFIAASRTYLGRPYDARYRMDDEAIYCSELIYKSFKSATGEAMGQTVTLGELDWKPYVETIRKYEGGEPPLDREMIAPRDLAKATQLRAVYRTIPEAK